MLIAISSHSEHGMTFAIASFAFDRLSPDCRGEQLQQTAATVAYTMYSVDLGIKTETGRLAKYRKMAMLRIFATCTQPSWRRSSVDARVAADFSQLGRATIVLTPEPISRRGNAELSNKEGIFSGIMKSRVHSSPWFSW